MRDTQSSESTALWYFDVFAAMPSYFLCSSGCSACHVTVWCRKHRRNFTLESGGYQWHRQDLVSWGMTIEAQKVRASTRQRCRVGSAGEGCPLPSRLGGLGEHRELPERGPGRSAGRYRIFCMFQATERFW